MKRSISFPDDLDSQILTMAKAQDRSYSNYVIHAVKIELKKQMSKYAINTDKQNPVPEIAELDDN